MTAPPKRVLYVHHTGSLGGSTLSLFYLLKNLDTSLFVPTVCLTEEGEAERLYRSHGITVKKCPAARFAHTTLRQWPIYRPSSIHSLARWLMQFPAACQRLRYIAKQIKPQIVHLNSLTLAPYASVFSQQDIPTVVHVREPVVDGLIGIRKHWLGRLVREKADYIIYICKDNRDRLTGLHPKGHVIYNPVDFGVFNRDIDRITARQELSIPKAARVVLFVGGLSVVKGLVPFVQAMQEVARRTPDLYCLLPSSQRSPSKSRYRMLLRNTANHLGIYSAHQKAERILKSPALSEKVLRTPFRLDIERFFAAADVVVVPFIRPHFARPVIEAGAMAKPVVASRVGGVEEVIDENVNGILVPPGDTTALASAVMCLLDDPETASQMGEAGYSLAMKRYSANRHVEQVTALYATLLG